MECVKLDSELNVEYVKLVRELNRLLDVECVVEWVLDVVKRVE